MLGVLAALGLFLLMHGMLGPQADVLPSEVGPVVINMPYRIIPDEVEPIRKPPPEPEPLKAPPEAPRLEMQSPRAPVTQTLEIDMPEILPGSGSGPSLPGPQRAEGSRTAMPGSGIVIRPVYPGDAIRKGLEGFVTLQIDIAADGSVTAARVIDSEPGRVFDSAALRAVYRSRFAPAIEQGQAVPGRVVQTVYFKLEDEQ